MRGKYYRYLFENLDGGLIYTGSIYDKEWQKTTNLVYMSGGRYRNTTQNRIKVFYEEEVSIPNVIDILVVGSYSAKYVNKLIDIVRNCEIKMIILPYLAPIQRLVLVEEMKGGAIAGKEAVRFLQDPFQFLKKYGIEKIYFLYGNGPAVNRDPEELDSRFCFEQTEEKLLCLIRDMEGYAIPAVKAGYFVENGFLFYFGMYGLDIQVLSDFTKEYFSNLENIHEISENVSEDYTSQMKRLLQEYMRKFGNSPVTTVTMFESPLYASAQENSCFMTEKEFSRKKVGEAWERCTREERCACVISCSHRKDHDMMRRYKGNAKNVRFGVFMLGNANLNRYLPEILTRFSKVLSRIRGISVPNCGNGEDWNHQILEFLRTKDRIYWICSKHDMTSAGVVSDIVLSSSNNRFLSVDERWGCCISGYIIPKEDMD